MGILFADIAILLLQACNTVHRLPMAYILDPLCMGSVPSIPGHAC